MEVGEVTFHTKIIGKIFMVSREGHVGDFRGEGGNHVHNEVPGALWEREREREGERERKGEDRYGKRMVELTKNRKKQ